MTIESFIMEISWTCFCLFVCLFVFSPLLANGFPETRQRYWNGYILFYDRIDDLSKTPRTPRKGATNSTSSSGIVTRSRSFRSATGSLSTTPNKLCSTNSVSTSNWTLKRNSWMNQELPDVDYRSARYRRGTVWASYRSCWITASDTDCSVVKCRPESSRPFARRTCASWNRATSIALNTTSSSTSSVRYSHAHTHTHTTVHS